MPVRFIFGPTGSGKSTEIYKEAMRRAAEGKDVYLVVPEQANLLAAQEFLSMSAAGCAVGFDVVSVDTLARRLCDRSGIRLPDVVTETGKTLLVKKALLSINDSLTVLKRQTLRAGFVDTLKSTVSECMQYGVTADILEGAVASGSLSRTTAMKAADVSMLLTAVDECLGDSITSDQFLETASCKAGMMKGLENTVLLFDGFTGLTPGQKSFLGAVMDRVFEVWVTITVDKASLDRDMALKAYDLFYMAEKYLDAVSSLAASLNMAVEPPIVLDASRHYNSPGVRLLSEHLFSPVRAVKTSTDDVVIHKAKTPLSEVEAVAAGILRLVRDGGRFRDSAVICSDLPGYREHIKRVFHREGIPYFIDDTQDISHTQAATFLLSALDAVIHDSRPAVLRFLKSGYVTDMKTASLMENYCLEKGIFGFSSWKKKWSRQSPLVSESELSQMNEIRADVYDALHSLSGFKSSGNVNEVVKCLYGLFARYHVEEHVADATIPYLEKHGYLRDADRVSQVYSLCLDVFDQMTNALGEQVLPLSDIRDILCAGFMDVRVGSVPATVDCVICGDMERTRLPRIKALYMVGMTDKVTETSVNTDILNAADRRHLMEQAEIYLRPAEEEQASFKRYYFYLAVSKPSENLILSYPECGNDGTGTVPCSYLADIEKVVSPMHTDGTHDAVSGPWDALSRLREGLGREITVGAVSERSQGILEALWTFPEYRDEVRECVRASFEAYAGERIPGSLLRRIYSDSLDLAPVRLEAAARCYQAHFLNYAMHIREREEYVATAKDIGTLYHETLKDFFDRMRASGTEWASLSEDAIGRAVSDSVDMVADSYRESVFRDNGKNRYFVSRVKSVTASNICVMAAQIRESGYHVFDTESPFGGFRITLDNGREMMIHGIIDRVDRKQSADGTEYMRVIDYKTGNVSFSPILISNGLQLQLSLYLLASVEKASQAGNGAFDVRPGGAVYYRLKEPYVDVTDDMSYEQVASAQAKVMEPSGIVSIAAEPDNRKAVPADEMEMILKEAVKAAKRLGDDILSGDVSARPYRHHGTTGCDYCAYRAICGFDPDSPGYTYREITDTADTDGNMEQI